MCDLIDFNSPSTKNAIISKLASPLIPSPATPTTSASNIDTPNTVSAHPSSSCNGKRGKWNDNPFDLALHNMMEYASKKEDPFEVVFEKALKCKNECNMPRTCYTEFKDDFTPTRKRPSEILKMNKTLDDSSMDIHLNTSFRSKDAILNMIEDESIIQDLNNTNLLSDTCKNKEDHVSMKENTMPNITVQPSSPAETSILSQSLLNDTLSESSSNSPEQTNKLRRISSICAQTKNIDRTKLSFNEALKFSKLRRSLSANETNSPKKLKQYRLRSHSTAEIFKSSASGTSSVSSVSSVLFDDSMNKAFLEPRISNSSFQTDISNISTISKLNSTSKYDYSSSIFSDGSMNRAFVDSCSSTKCSKTFDFSSPALRRLKSVSSLKSANITSSASNSADMSDLVSTLQKMQINSTEIPISEIETVRSDVNEMNCISDKIDKGIINPTVSDNQPKMEDKLLDVDVFDPEMENHAERSTKNSTSSLSSIDSVFAVNSKLATSIMEEANALAKLFGELAHKSESTISSSDDLLNSRPRWNFDELPPSDDEQDVENLIELPSSPGNPESITGEKSELEIIRENKLLDLNDVKKKEVKELEEELIDPTTSDNKMMAATLLFDLEKLVKLENNLEAATLLHNLEKALGVKCENNVELLTTCLQNTNHLGKSPKKSNNVKDIDNIQAESIEKSDEDNANIDKSLNTKELNDSANKDLANNLNTDKKMNKTEKTLVIAQNALDEIAPITEEIGETSDTVFNDSVVLENEKNHEFSEQKIAAELLINIGKALSGENKDPSTINLLASIGKILNVSTSHLNCDGSQQNNSEHGERKTPTKKTVYKSKVQYPSNLSKSMNRKSLDSSSKEHTANEKLPRRSLSGSRTNGTHGTSVSIEKTKSLPRDMKKRFSSDSDIMNRRSMLKDVKVKPVVVPDIRKEKAPTLINTVKNKLRKKSDADVIKKGPMKAIVPLGNMQRRGSLGKRVAPSLGSITPPKVGFTTPSAFTVTNSTPNPSFNIPVVKNSPKTKPVASSTPDAEVSKARRIVSRLSQTSMKRNVSCNISPVIPDINTNNAATASKGSPRVFRHNKTLSPPKGQSPKSRHAHNKTECSIPKYSPLVGLARKNSFSESTRVQDRLGSPKSSLTKSHLPLTKRKSESELLQSSPLKNNNKLATKIKPLNLFSKLHRRSGMTADKENQS